MKNLVLFLVSCFLLLACSDVVDLSQRQDMAVSNDALKNANGISTLDIGPVNPYVWTELQVPPLSNYFQYYPFNTTTQDNILLPVNNEVYYLIGSLQEFVFKLNKATKRWEYLPYPNNIYSTALGTAGYRYLFSYQSKFYWGLRGNEPYVGSSDVVTGINEEVASFPGTPVSNPTCFVVGSKGYIIGGYNSATNNAVNQFWEYDFIANQWTNKGGLPGGARAGASAYVLNDKVYFGLGYDIITLNGQRITRFKKDWYQMNPANSGGYAITRTNFPGTSKRNPLGFTINDKFYLGWGQANDFWEYNPATNKWTQKDNLPVTGSSEKNIGVFAIDNTGYLVQGWMGEFWRYSNSSIVPIP